jgi:hypothetical protein
MTLEEFSQKDPGTQLLLLLAGQSGLEIESSNMNKSDLVSELDRAITTRYMMYKA